LRTLRGRPSAAFFILGRLGRPVRYSAKSFRMNGSRNTAFWGVSLVFLAPQPL
jgi:hypothetical protein